MVSTVRPNANATPTKPMPSPWTGPAKLAARTALPQPPRTSQNVPNSSAARRFDNCMIWNPKKFDLLEAVHGYSGTHLRAPNSREISANRVSRIVNVAVDSLDYLPIKPESI